MSFIIKPGDPVYYPAISNLIFEKNTKTKYCEIFGNKKCSN